MSKVLSLKQDDFQGSDGMVTCWKVELDDRTQPVPCYSGEASTLKIGEPLPDGWEVKVSKKGKDYLAVPKATRTPGQSSWYNSEAGVRFTQERMDRRTALMQAVAVYEDGSPVMFNTSVDGRYVGLNLADTLYAWLRDSSGVLTEPISSPAGAARGTTTDPKAATTSEVSEDVRSGKGEPSTPAGPWGEAVLPEGVEGTASPSDAIKEPHEHVRGRQLASGKYLCNVVLDNGLVCGEKMA